MGNPGLLKELPDIAALLPQGGGDREQAAAADGTTGHQTGAGSAAPPLLGHTSNGSCALAFCSSCTSVVAGKKRHTWSCVTIA